MMATLIYQNVCNVKLDFSLLWEDVWKYLPIVVWFFRMENVWFALLILS